MPPWQSSRSNGSEDLESSLNPSIVDKGTLAASSVMGIQTDNKLHGQQYALLGTILYIGILIGEVRCPHPVPLSC